MRLPALLLVAGLFGWGAQAHAGAPEDTAGAAEAPAKPAKDKPTIANRGQNKQAPAKPPRNKAAKTADHKQTTAGDICRRIAQAASENELPVAAGYNAGPGRVREWLDGKGALPRETRDYVEGPGLH